MDTEKSRLCTGFSIFHGFRHSLGVLECMPHGWWGWGGGPLEALGILDESQNGQKNDDPEVVCEGWEVNF